MLRSLGELRLSERWEVLAVDNGSTDASADILMQFAGKLPLTLLSEQTPGKNRALNKAVRHARGDLLVFTDDDIIADSRWLASLRSTADEHPDFSVFGGRIKPHWLSPPAQVILRNAPLGITYALTPENQKTGPIFPGLVWGPNMAVRRRVFDAGHWFDESVGPSGRNYVMGSETEFTIRVEQRGYRSWFTNDAVVCHIIRTHQTVPDWVIRRAYRFGRNQWIQIGGTETGSKLAGIPRWRFSAYGAECFKYLGARFKRDADALFKARWEISFLSGYFSEAFRRWRSAH